MENPSFSLESIHLRRPQSGGGKVAKVHCGQWGKGGSTDANVRTFYGEKLFKEKIGAVYLNL